MRYRLIIFLILTAVMTGTEADKSASLFQSGYFQELIDYTDSLNHEEPGFETHSLFRGIAFYNLKEYREAVKVLGQTARVSDSPEIKDISNYYTALSEIRSDNSIDGAVILSRLLNSSSSRIATSSRIILENLIESKFNERDHAELMNLISDFEVKNILDKSKNSLKILAVLPLTGPDQEDGKKILTGLEFGIKRIGGEERNISFDVINSEGKIPVMVKKILERLNSTRYNLIVGELRSDATAALAGIADLKQIPLISPTAAAKDISSISDRIFQLNTSSYTFGRLIAEYAVDSLKYRTFAIISPLTEDGNESVSGFTSKVVEKGCSVLALEWFFDSYDINKQIQRIREKVLSIDSLDTEEYMSTDSIKAVPAGVIDAFFLPVNFNDAESVLSQLSYYNFTASILGTYGWNDEKILKKLGVHADSLVFIKESSYDLDNTAYTDFVYKFRNEFNRNPALLEITGYSIISMMTDLREKHPDTPIYKVLGDLDFYKAVQGDINFAGSRSNSAAELKIYIEGKGLKDLKFNPQKMPDSLDAAKKYFNIAFVYETLKNFSSSAENYDRALKEYGSVLRDSNYTGHPDVLITYKRAGQVNFIIGNYAKADEYFLKYLEKHPDDLQTSFYSAVSKARTDPLLGPETISEYTQYPEIASEAYYETGRLYMEKSETGKALDYLEAAYTLKNRKAEKLLQILKKEEGNNNKFDW